MSDSAFFRVGAALVAAASVGGCADDAESPPCPLSSSGNPHVVDLQGAEDITMALLSDGTAHCWGDDKGGACGYRSAGFFPWPVRNEAADCLVGIGLGEGSISAGITADGKLLVWGPEAYQAAEAGDGAEKGPGLGRSTQVNVPTPRSVRINFGHGIAITDAGELYYWGAIVDGWHIDVPTLYSSPRPVVSGDTERHTTCFVTDDGAVFCFGSNRHGQLSIPPSTAEKKFEPTQVPLPAPAQKVEVGLDFACAHLQNGEVWCWGQNVGTLFGQPFEDLPLSEAPVKIEGLPEVRELFANYTSPCVIDTADHVTCWGGGIPSQPPDLLKREWHPELSVARLALGENRVCALLLDGRVFCDGAYAGLGDTGTMTITGFVDLDAAIAESKHSR